MVTEARYSTLLSKAFLLLNKAKKQKQNLFHTWVFIFILLDNITRLFRDCLWFVQGSPKNLKKLYIMYIIYNTGDVMLFILMLFI